MELWDIYDSDRNKTGRLAVRGGTPLAEGEYHLTVHVAIFREDGKMLIQQRASDKDTWPSMWDITVGGAVTAGENSRTGGERELAEELGIVQSLSGIRPAFTMNKSRVFCDCYTLERDVDLDTLVFQESEVQAAKYASVEEILELIEKGEFIPYRESFLRLLYDLRQRV